jgi:hypothetical protein
VSRRISRDFALGNGRREPHGIHADCVLCDNPAVFPADTRPADRVCQGCLKTIAEAERLYPWPKDDAGGLDRLLDDMDARFPDPPGQRSDTSLCVALGVSALRLRAAREGSGRGREDAEADFDEGFEGGRR